MGLLPTLGARLAKLTSNPDLMITDGESRILGGVPPLGARADVVEGWMPFRLVLDVVPYGKRHVMMGATQIDREGNQNISAIGDWAQPKRQLLGVRGAPGNTVNNRTSYWVPKHSPRVFVEQVDIVSGVGPHPRGGRRRGRRPVPRRTPRRQQPRGPRLRRPRRHAAPAVGAPGCHRRGGPRAVRVRAPVDAAGGDAETRSPGPTSWCSSARCSTPRACATARSPVETAR